MSIDVRPATVFEDVRAVIGPKSPTSNVCFCLSYRIPSKLNNTLRGPERGAYVEGLCQATPAPGVLAYDGDTPVGWAAVAPRAATTFARNRKIPHVDELPVWSLWCIRVRPGHRGQGISHALIAGAVEFARENGAPVVEAYPLDNGDSKVDARTSSTPDSPRPPTPRQPSPAIPASLCVSTCAEPAGGGLVGVVRPAVEGDGRVGSELPGQVDNAFE